MQVISVLAEVLEIRCDIGGIFAVQGPARTRHAKKTNEIDKTKPTST